LKNVLFLSAGRRVELVQAFLAEMRERDREAKLFAVDFNAHQSAACQVADKFFSAPRVTEPSYISFVLELCKANDICLIIPTIDTELIPLARYREKFNEAGINVVISDLDLVRRCRDKRLTADLFQELGIKSPAIFSKNALHLPCFAKPYDGSSSVGAKKIDSNDQITSNLLSDEKIMFMELVGLDYTEYTVDTYFDQAGELRCLVPRKRIEIRAGEISKGLTQKDKVYDYVLPKIKKLIGARGCITLQLFVRDNPEDFLGLEINPRFGGGYPLAYAAKANFVGWLLDEYLFGKDIPFFDAWEENLMMLRYDAKVLVHGTT
jgi:carbamoyl-phosphate synthase large subunit